MGTIPVQELRDVYEAFQKESDRGCALISAAMLDSALEDFLRGYLVEDKPVLEGLLGQMRPLGTFSARIDIVYLMGLVSREVRRDFDLIRRIRNKFGHSMDALDFEHPSIRPLCLEIQSASRPGVIIRGDAVRDRFIYATVYLFGIIHGLGSEVMRREFPAEAPALDSLKIPVGIFELSSPAE